MLAALPFLLWDLPRGFGPLAFSTVGDAADGLLPFGWDVAGFQKWTLIYLGVSSLAFVLVWLVGYLRR
ncbi:MAG: 5'-phosphoribosylglycinamide transformylase [Cyanobium sp. CZS 25K]|nr:5'-phosphoribosylglycinamide transformylase [Cyanobium sp. CZS25K]